jgi:hypothetical protein
MRWDEMVGVQCLELLMVTLRRCSIHRFQILQIKIVVRVRVANPPESCVLRTMRGVFLARNSHHLLDFRHLCLGVFRDLTPASAIIRVRALVADSNSSSDFESLNQNSRSSFSAVSSFSSSTSLLRTSSATRATLQWRF